MGCPRVPKQSWIIMYRLNSVGQTTPATYGRNRKPVYPTRKTMWRTRPTRLYAPVSRMTLAVAQYDIATNWMSLGKHLGVINTKTGWP